MPPLSTLYLNFDPLCTMDGLLHFSCQTLIAVSNASTLATCSVCVLYCHLPRESGADIWWQNPELLRPTLFGSTTTDICTRPKPLSSGCLLISQNQDCATLYAQTVFAHWDQPLQHPRAWLLLKLEGRQFYAQRPA